MKRISLVALALAAGTLMLWLVLEGTDVFGPLEDVGVSRTKSVDPRIAESPAVGQAGSVETVPFKEVAKPTLDGPTIQARVLGGAARNPVSGATVSVCDMDRIGVALRQKNAVWGAPRGRAVNAAASG